MKLREIPERFGGSHGGGEAAPAQEHGQSMEFAARGSVGRGVVFSQMFAEITAFHDYRHQSRGGDGVCFFQAGGREHGGVGPEVGDQKIVEQGSPFRYAEGGACFLELGGVVLSAEGLGGAHVVAEMSESDTGAEDMPHYVDVDQQQFEQRRGRGDGGGVVGEGITAL